MQQIQRDSQQSNCHDAKKESGGHYRFLNSCGAIIQPAGFFRVSCNIKKDRYERAQHIQTAYACEEEQKDPVFRARCSEVIQVHCHDERKESTEWILVEETERGFSHAWHPIPPPSKAPRVVMGGKIWNAATEVQQHYPPLQAMPITSICGHWQVRRYGNQYGKGYQCLQCLAKIFRHRMGEVSFHCGS